jgi:putative redox protein
VINTWKWGKVSYLNKQGLKLSGLLYSGANRETIVIVCHGFLGSKEGGGRALAMAEEIGKLGYATLLFDFSGCGESEGAFADITLTRQIEDLTCSVDYNQESGFKKIITLGRSFGGTTALCHGALDKRTAGVCTWSLRLVWHRFTSCLGKRKSLRDFSRKALCIMFSHSKDII